jgi:transcription antitermination factor NusG
MTQNFLRVLGRLTLTFVEQRDTRLSRFVGSWRGAVGHGPFYQPHLCKKRPLSRKGEALSSPLTRPQVQTVSFHPDQAPQNWYAVYTLPNHEKRVAEHFQTRGIEGFLPLYRAEHRWNNGCKVTVSRPLFPNYVFVHIAARDWVRVIQVPSVRMIVGTRRELSPLPELEIEALRVGLHQCQAQPHPYLRVGNDVRIKSGPLAGLEGVISRTTESLRVVICINLIMRSVSVEVDAHQLELLSGSSVS